MKCVRDNEIASWIYINYNRLALFNTFPVCVYVCVKLLGIRDNKTPFSPNRASLIHPFTRIFYICSVDTVYIYTGYCLAVKFFESLSLQLISREHWMFSVLRRFMWMEKF